MPSNLRSVFVHEMRGGVGIAFRWVLLPALIIVILGAVIGGGSIAYYAFQQSNNSSLTPPDVMNPDDTGATTDMYADTFLSAIDCMNQENSSCDLDNRKSDLIVLASQEVLVVNGEKYPVPSAEDVPKAVEDAGLGDFDVTEFSTTEEGSTDDTIVYTSDTQTLTLKFKKDDNGELVVSSIELEDK